MAWMYCLHQLEVIPLMNFSTTVLPLALFMLLSMTYLLFWLPGNSRPSAGTVTNVGPWIPTYDTLGNKNYSSRDRAYLKDCKTKKFYPHISSKGVKATNATLDDA